MVLLLDQLLQHLAIIVPLRRLVQVRLASCVVDDSLDLVSCLGSYLRQSWLLLDLDRIDHWVRWRLAIATLVVLKPDSLRLLVNVLSRSIIVHVRHILHRYWWNLIRFRLDDFGLLGFLDWDFLQLHEFFIDIVYRVVWDVLELLQSLGLELVDFDSCRPLFLSGPGTGSESLGSVFCSLVPAH